MKTITSAKYLKNLDGDPDTIHVVDKDYGGMFVPLDPQNTDYAEIMKQVDAGELTIEPADE
jgi:hypothetical protein